jgi:D-xylose transport system ATP-binding protein
MSQKANAAPRALDKETPVPVFGIRSASKYFGGVTALQAVSLDVHAAKIVAIVGDNGAGKSTLIKAISGTQPPDEGTFFFQGQPVEIKSPQDARRLGVETAYQDLAFCDNLDTVQNLFLGNEIISSTSTGRRLKHAAMEQLSAEVLCNLSVTTILKPPETPGVLLSTQ